MQYLVGQSQSLKETLDGHGAELRVGILAQIGLIEVLPLPAANFRQGAVAIE